MTQFLDRDEQQPGARASGVGSLRGELGNGEREHGERQHGERCESEHGLKGHRLDGQLLDGQLLERFRRGGKGLSVAGAAVMALSVFVLCIGVILTVDRASAAYERIAETGQPGYLVLSAATETPLWTELSPGESMYWLVEASLIDAKESSLALELRANGGLIDPAGMIAEVSTCTEDFTVPAGVPVCTATTSAALPATPLTELNSSGDRYQLPHLWQDQPRQVAVALTLPAATTAGQVEGQVAQVGLGLHASGQDATPTPTPANPQLPVTGSDLLALGVLGAGLIGLGIGIALRRRGVSVAARSTSEATA